MRAKRLNLVARRVLAVLLALEMAFGGFPLNATLSLADDVPEQEPIFERQGEDSKEEPANPPAPAADDTPEGDAVLDVQAPDEGAAPENGIVEAVDEEGDLDDPDAADEPVLLAAAAGGGGGPLRNGAAPGTVTTVDTNALGINVNLFNYVANDTTANTYDKDKTGATASTTGINTGKSWRNQLKFYGSGDGVETPVTYNNNSTSGTTTGANPGNGINQFTGVARGNNNRPPTFYTLQYANQGIVQRELSADGFPLLNTNASDKTTQYLFDPDTTPADASSRQVYEGVNHLFYLENAGTASERLVYDSNEHYAYYDVSQGDGGDFKVYDGTYDRAGGSKSGMKVGFFPFNDWYTGSGYPQINPNNGATQVDHHLGLTLDFPFTMPLDGVVRTESGDEAPLEFEFSGDDDMWVFVDGKLVLDIGGIHQPVSGTINFETGVVQIGGGTENPPVYFFNNYDSTPKYVTQGSYSYLANGISDTSGQHGDIVYMWDVYGFENGDRTKPILTGTGTPLIAGILGNKNSSDNRAGTEHRMQAFYLERGGCDSNLMVTTNFHLMAKRTVTVNKVWGPGVEDADKEPVEVELVRKETPINGGEVSEVSYAVVDTATLQNGAWSKSWKKLPTEGWDAATDSIYCKYTYFVREKPKDGFSPTYSGGLQVTQIEYTGVNGEYCQISNNYAPVSITNMPTYIDVTKEWKNRTGDGADPASHANDSVWVQLYKQTREDAQSDWSDETAVGDPVELKASVDWTHRFKVSETGENVRYLVKEGAMDGTTFVPLAEDGVIMAAKTSASDTGKPYVLDSVSYENRTADMTQTPPVYGDWTSAGSDYVTVPDNGTARATVANKPVSTKVTVEKQWSDSATVSEHPAIWVQLYKDGNAVGGPVQLSGTTLEHEFPNLDPSGVYTVAEGTYASGTFTPQTSFTITSGGQTRTYVQDSITYYDAGSSDPRTQDNLDGTVYPDAGRAVIVNRPPQVDISLVKVDADSTSGADPIEGVTFELLEDAGQAGVYEPTVDTTVVAPDITTSATGEADLPKLEPGTYWLLETEAADGYLLRDPNHPIGITVTADGTSMSVALVSDGYDSNKTRPTIAGPDNDGAYTLTARNVRTYTLPSAGGPGAYPFLLIGAFVAAYAASGVSGSRRKGKTRPQGRPGRPGDPKDGGRWNVT